VLHHTPLPFGFRNSLIWPDHAVAEHCMVVEEIEGLEDHTISHDISLVNV
jgi:hypothetical protein